MRVMHVISGLRTGGAEMMLVKLLATMDRAKFDPIVVSLRGDGPISRPLEDIGIPIEPVGLGAASTLLAGLWRLGRLARRHDADLIQGWMYHGNLAAQLVGALSRGRPPVLWNIRQSIDALAEEKRSVEFLIRRGVPLSRRAAGIVYNSHHSAQQHEALGYATEGRHIIPNGFDCTRYAPSPALRAQVRSELGIPADAPLIGQMARYDPMKDHRGFLAAAGRLSADFPDARFLMAGSGVDHDNAELTGQVAQLGLGARVHMIGERTDMPAVLAALDVATSSSSRNEGFPTVLGEAMACGVPCVATDVGDSRRVVGDCGVIVPPSDPDSLAAAWRGMLDAEPEQRRQLGMAARGRIVQHFSIATVADIYETLYRQTVQ